jgi:hypothetical protein
MSADRYGDLVEASSGHQHGGSESAVEQDTKAPEQPGESHTHVRQDAPTTDDHSTTPPHQH